MRICGFHIKRHVPMAIWTALLAGLVFSASSSTPLFAGEAMTANDTSSNSEVAAARHLVEVHLQQYFSLSPSQVEITFLSHWGKMPAGAMLFAANLRRTMDYPPYNYIAINGRVYCGWIKGEFERFLKEYGYFDKLDLDREQLMNLYVTLGPGQHLQYYDESLLGPGPYKDIKPPVLTQSKSGLTLTFYARPWFVVGEAPRLWTVTLSPDYHLEVHPPEPKK